MVQIHMLSNSPHFLQLNNCRSIIFSHNDPPWTLLRIRQRNNKSIDYMDVDYIWRRTSLVPLRVVIVCTADAYNHAARVVPANYLLQ